MVVIVVLTRHIASSSVREHNNDNVENASPLICLLFHHLRYLRATIIICPNCGAFPIQLSLYRLNVRNAKTVGEICRRQPEESLDPFPNHLRSAPKITPGTGPWG